MHTQPIRCKFKIYARTAHSQLKYSTCTSINELIADEEGEQRKEKDGKREREFNVQQMEVFKRLIFSSF